MSLALRRKALVCSEEGRGGKSSILVEFWHLRYLVVRLST